MAIVNTDNFNNRPFFQRLGFYMPFMIIVGLLVPVLIYLAVMKTIGWQVSTLDANGDPECNSLCLFQGGEWRSRADVQKPDQVYE